MIQCWSCGGGTQSAAIAALICEGKLPKPDYALMADTEREKSSTWRYVANTLQPRLKAAGVDLVIVRKSDYATVDLYSGNGDLLLPVYTSGGKLPGFCSNEWKTRVLNRWIFDHAGIKSTGITYWIGYSLGEMSRVRAGRFRYPLILEHPMRRNDCVAYVESLGWESPPPGGSACWMCPNMGDREWIELRDKDPEDFARACEMDEKIRAKDPDVFLHPSRQPLVEIAPLLGNTQGNLFSAGCTGMCMV